MKQASPFKHLLLLSILLAASLHAFSQHFDWVRTYTGQEVTSGVATNQLVGSCVDSAGNLYILGEFSPQAFFCGERLLPFDIITTPIQRAVVIAKLSQSGELLWHKAIYNGKVSCYAYALRMVGDSSIMAMVHFDNPYFWSYSESYDLYYLDTLITGNSDYLMPRDSVGRRQNGFITFDFDGNVTEQHFVCVGYMDSVGNTLTSRITRGTDLDQMTTNFLSGESFNIDANGNIYVIRSVHADYIIGPYDASTNDYRMWRVDDGTIGALKIAVDGTHFLKYEIPRPTALWNQQVLKFSPHFDSLLDAVYMFDSTLNRQCGSIKVNSFSIDAQSNLYLSMLGGQVPAHLSIANSNSLHLGDSLLASTWVIKYNSNLYATDLIQLSHSRNNDSDNTSQIGVCACYVDDNTNSIFVSGYVRWSASTDVTNIFFNDDTLNLPNKSGFWLRLDKDDFRILSMGRALPGENGEVTVFPKLAMNKMRVFSEVGFRQNIAFADTIIYTNQNTDYDHAFVIWDYSGNGLFYKKHGLHNMGNILHSPHVKDSIVYLTGSIWEGATFGDITTQNYGYSQVYIAKYVDPAFAQPYEHPSDRQEQSIVWQQELSFNLADSPILLTAAATSGLPVSYTSSDSTIAYVEGGRLHLVADGHAWLTATQEGDYQYFPAEPVQRLLTVGNVGIATVGADGQAKAYPNPTSGRVTIDLAEISPAPPLPYHRPRPSDTSDVDMVLYTSPGAPFPQYETCRFPYHQRYNMKVSGSALQSRDGVVTAWLTDMQGRREEVVLTPTGPDRYTLDLTSRPPAAYLLTVTTADGRELTFRLMRQYGRK